MTARQELDALLRETPAAARVREQSAFDEIAGKQRRVVIFGAGRLGRKILAGLAGTDLEPIAFADNNPDLWGKVVNGLPVVSPSDAKTKYSTEATFVVAIWHPSQAPLISALLKQVHGLGCRVAAFPVLFWRHPDRFLPYFFWDLPSQLLQKSAELVAAFALADDDASRRAFAAQVQLRLHADFDRAGTPAPGAQYFPGLFSISADECFVDCGAYTGDTIQAFLAQTNHAFRKVIAFEADPSVMPRLENFMKDVGSRGIIHKVAVGAINGKVYFSGDGIGGGRVTGDTPATLGKSSPVHTHRCWTCSSHDCPLHNVEVPCVRLDDALAKERVSFIKMDIEGAELQALEGARGIIKRDRPVLAVCGYHMPDHLFRVPLFLKTLGPCSLLFLRPHCADGLDSVWYSVPRERRVHIVTTRIRKPNRSRVRARGSHEIH